MIYVSNEDRPGFIGRFASILGNAKVNIATFALGRDREGGSAVALVEVDGVLLDTILAEVKTLPASKRSRRSHFEAAPEGHTVPIDLARRGNDGARVVAIELDHAW